MAFKGNEKTIYILGFAIILFLIILIISGRILDDINKSSNYSSNPDAKLKNAHSWAMWTVIICSVAIAICLGIMIFLFVKKNKIVIETTKIE